MEAVKCNVSMEGSLSVVVQSRRWFQSYGRSGRREWRVWAVFALRDPVWTPHATVCHHVTTGAKAARGRRACLPGSQRTSVEHIHMCSRHTEGLFRPHWLYGCRDPAPERQKMLDPTQGALRASAKAKTGLSQHLFTLWETRPPLPKAEIIFHFNLGATNTICQLVVQYSSKRLVLTV